MRAGVGFDKNGHTNGSDDVAHKVGRLGSESRLYGEIGLGADIAKVDDTVWSVQNRIAYKSTLNRDWQSADNENDEEHAHFAFREFNVSVKEIHITSS